MTDQHYQHIGKELNEEHAWQIGKGIMQLLHWESPSQPYLIPSDQ
jgi:hypothetical protein